MKHSKGILSKLLASIIGLTLLQGCSNKAVRLTDGTSFDESDHYALVIFGVGTENRSSRHYDHDFKKWDPETGQPDGSCFSFVQQASVNVPPLPNDGDAKMYMAFKVAEGPYIGQVAPEDTREYKTVSFAVEAGQAYYVGDLIQYGDRLVKAETNYSDAASWASSHLDIQVPLKDTPLTEYKSRLYHRMCWP